MLWVVLILVGTLLGFIMVYKRDVNYVSTYTPPPPPAPPPPERQLTGSSEPAPSFDINDVLAGKRDRPRA